MVSFKNFYLLFHFGFSFYVWQIYRHHSVNLSFGFFFVVLQVKFYKNGVCQVSFAPVHWPIWSVFCQFWKGLNFKSCWVFFSGSCLARYLRRNVLSSGVTLQECHGTSTILYWDYNKSCIGITRLVFYLFCFWQVTLNFGPDFKFPPTDEEFQPVWFKQLIHYVFIISAFVFPCCCLLVPFTYFNVLFADKNLKFFQREIRA